MNRWALAAYYFVSKMITFAGWHVPPLATPRSLETRTVVIVLSICSYYDKHGQSLITSA